MMIRRLVGLGACAVLLAGCAAIERDYQGEGAGRVGQGAPVAATLETPSVGTAGQDAADDPAVWGAPSPVHLNGMLTPGFVAGTDKKSGLYIYGLDGAILQFLPDGLLNNVDVVEGISLQGRPQAVLGASDRTPGRVGIALYTFDISGDLTAAVRFWGRIATDVVEPYGFCFARLGADIHAILIGHEGEVRQFVLTADRAGNPTAREVRRFDVGSISEGCAADEATNALYIAEENVGWWRYPLIPADPAQRILVAPVATGRLVADAEGLTIIADGPARYLIGSSQGDSTFPVWRIDRAEPAYVGRFVVRAGVVDAVTGTDGLAAHSGPIGPFPEGVVVIQDDVNDTGTQNFKYVDWRDIRRALGL